MYIIIRLFFTLLPPAFHCSRSGSRGRQKASREKRRLRAYHMRISHPEFIGIIPVSDDTPHSSSSSPQLLLSLYTTPTCTCYHSSIFSRSPTRQHCNAGLPSTRLAGLRAHAGSPTTAQQCLRLQTRPRPLRPLLSHRAASGQPGLDTARDPFHQQNFQTKQAAPRRASAGPR